MVSRQDLMLLGGVLITCPVVCSMEFERIVMCLALFGAVMAYKRPLCRHGVSSSQ